jgi:capsular polysaccharide biosynthesis protein
MLSLNRTTALFRLAPYMRLARRVLRGRGTLDSIASETVLLCPPETSEHEPPVFLPGQLDRLTAGTEHQPLEAEIQSMLATTFTHDATIAYHIRDAVIYDGSAYAGNLRHVIADKNLFSASDTARYLKTAGLASTYVGNRYFGHWLADDCVQFLLAETTGAAACFSTPAWPHKARYANWFGQDWTPTDRAVVDDLVIYVDHAQNSLKLRRYALLSQKIRAAFSTPSIRDKRVYLRRGRTGIARPISEEDKLLERLARIGFVILDIVSDDLELIIKTLLQARLVVSMEGSHIAHCCFTLAENCGLLVLQPSDRFAAVHRHWAARVNVHFGFVVGIASPSGYKFSETEILQTAELLLNI